MKTDLCFILCGLLLFCAACDKDDPPKPVPPITQENTFSCKINGEVFIPEPHGVLPTSPGIRVILHNGNSWLFDLANKRRDIYIYIYNVTATGKFTIVASDGDNDFFGETENRAEMEDDLLKIDYASLNNNEEINILELEINKSIIFEFDEITLVNVTDPTDVLVLSEGKLNVNLETLNAEE